LYKKKKKQPQKAPQKTKLGGKSADASGRLLGGRGSGDSPVCNGKPRQSIEHPLPGPPVQPIPPGEANARTLLQTFSQKKSLRKKEGINSETKAEERMSSLCKSPPYQSRKGKISQGRESRGVKNQGVKKKTLEEKCRKLESSPWERSQGNTQPKSCEIPYRKRRIARPEKKRSRNESSHRGQEKAGKTSARARGQAKKGGSNSGLLLS